MYSSGLSDIISELKRYNFEMVELNPEDTVSGAFGFNAIRDGVTINYDGDLFVAGERLTVPDGTEFDINLPQHVTWFLENFDKMVKIVRGEKHKA